MSLLGKYPCTNVTAPTYLSYSSASVTILSVILASVGNLLVVLAVLLDPPYKDLRSPFNYFVVILGFADLIVGLLTCPLGAVYLISEGLIHPNQQFRVWMHMTHFISCTASLLSLTYSFGILRSLCCHHIPSAIQNKAESNPSVLSLGRGVDSFNLIIADLLPCWVQ